MPTHRHTHTIRNTHNQTHTLLFLEMIRLTYLLHVPFKKDITCSLSTASNSRKVEIQSRKVSFALFVSKKDVLIMVVFSYVRFDILLKTGSKIVKPEARTLGWSK